MSDPVADRNLLLVLLALQMDFLDRDQLVAAMRPWMQDRTKPLDAVLVEQGLLSEKRRALLEGLVQEHIEQHGGDIEASIAAASAKGPTGTEITSAFLPDLSALLETREQTSDRLHPLPSSSQASERDAGQLAGGRFRVLELHGKGGLGQVMVARDEELGRTVALKEIQPRYADDPVSQERFVLEAEITGGLEHPCIVPVYGLGKYADGRPFYVMRFIRGEDLHKAIQKLHGEDGAGWDPGGRNVELHQLLRHFIDLCNGVQYAHSRGVLHRDIKPSNVMLGKFGETLVVDWGLAKIVGRSDPVSRADEATLRPSSGSGSHPTVMGSAIGTPAYMSPEQAAGDLNSLGPASDVYSLGATLYCLLTGRPAFTGDTRTALERVKKGDFPSPRCIQPEIPRPLEAVCLKAMALCPSDRYPSPRALAADIERWIADEPVTAYRESRSEQIARWMRRHRTWVQAGAVTLLAATAFFTLTAVLVTRAWRNESAAKDEALSYFRDAQQAVDEWLTGVGHALQYYPGTDKPRERLLERAAASYEAFARKRSGQRDLELERGRACLRLGNLRVMLNDTTGASEAYESAARVFEPLERDRPDDCVCQVETANCRTNQGVVSMLKGRIEEADQAYQAAIAGLNRLVERFPEQTSPRQALAAALSNRGELLAATPRLEEAERELRRCIELLSGLRADEPKNSAHELSLVTAQDLLGRVLLERGRHDEAVREMQIAVRLSSTLSERAWDNPDCLDSRAATNVSLGTVLRQAGDYEAEAAAYERAVDDYRTLLRALPGAPQFEESLALTLTDLGSLQYKLGRADEAEKLLGEARPILHSLAGRYPQIAQYLAEGAYCQGTLGRLVRDRGNLTQAKELLEDAIEAFQSVIQPARETPANEPLKYLQSLALCQAHLGQTLCLLGQHEDANAAFQEAVATLAAADDKPPNCQDALALVYEYWGNARYDAGQHEEASRTFGQAADAWAALVASGAASADHRHNYARFLVRCPAKERRDAKKAIELAQQLTTDRPDNALFWNTLGAAFYRNGDWRSSVQTLERTRGIGPKDQAYGSDSLWLAMAKWQLNEQEAATAAYQRGVQWLEATLPHNPELRRLQGEAAELLGAKEG